MITRANSLLCKRLLLATTCAPLIALSPVVFTGCTSAKTSHESADDDVIDSQNDIPAESAESQVANDGAAGASSQVASDAAIPQALADDELGTSANSKSDLAISAPKPAPIEERPVIATEVGISDIRYVSRKSGGTVVVETSAPATYHTREVPGQSQVILEIANAQLPEKFKHPYVTKDFNQSITSVNAYQDKGSSTVRVVVQFKAPQHAEVRQDGMKLELTPSELIADIDGNPTLGGGSASADPDAIEASPYKPSGVPGGAVGDQDPRILPAKSVEAIDYDGMKYYGKPISIEVRDTPIRDVINIIAEQSGANIVMGSEVEGNVTMKLRQIPWDQALLILMKSKNLGYVRQGSILRIEPYAALQKETTQARLVVEAQKLAEPLRVKIIPLGYARAADLDKQIVPFLSHERGKVVPDTRTNSLVVTDIPEVIERVTSLVRALDIAPLQVLIEGKIVEATEEFERDLGVNWNFSGSPTALGSQQITPSFNTNNIGIPQTGGLLSMNVGHFDLFGDIGATLGLAEKDNAAHVVASPRVVAINNEPASMTQGQNIPVNQLTQSNGTSTISSQYTSVEMKLDVTPQVTSENDVIMQIKLKRDFLAQQSVAGSGQAPAIDHREASTRVLVRNGQTAVIGGVYQNDQLDTENSVPWVSKIPVIGWLFKSKISTKQKSELLVFLTPRILNAETSMQKESSL